MKDLVLVEKIESRIFHIRGKKVMLDRDLAALYQVETKQLTRQVRRNIKRFPEDFMFQLTRKEYQEFLRRQFGTLDRGKYSKYLPYAFTEQGIAMLSGVLSSGRAISVNIQIMRAFVNLRRISLTYAGLRRKIEDMEKKYDVQFKVVFDTLKRILDSPLKAKKKRIGFRQ